MTIDVNSRLKLERYLRFYCLPSRASNQAGFTMPLALGMGLMMIIVAASLIGRSQSDRATGSFQKESNRALSVSETGSIRVQSFLDRHKFLATKNLDKWINTLDILPSSQVGCSLINFTQAKDLALLFKDNSWISIDPSDPNKGRYKVVDYRYQNGSGKLTIVGEIAAYNTTQTSSTSKIIVDIPIGSEAANIAPPALWANTFNLNPTQKITGQIRAVTCPQPPAIDPDGVAGVDASQITAIAGVPSGKIIADPFTSLPPPKIAPSTANLLPAITGSIQLPRVGFTDLPDANNEYHYLIDLDSISSGYSLRLQDTDFIKITVPPSFKVNLYLKGNLDLAGSKTIGVDATHPNLRIYGSSTTTNLTIKNTADITAFIHAPLADAKSVNTSPSAPGIGIKGGIWVKSWDSMTSPNDLPIVQTGTWADLGLTKVEQPPQLSPISYWQRVEN